MIWPAPKAAPSFSVTRTPVAGALDLRDIGLGADLDALLLHLGGEMVADIVIEAAQDLLAAIDQNRLDAEAREDAGELDGDIAAADDARCGDGRRSRWKASLEVMASSWPGRWRGTKGAAPVAIRM